MLPLIGELIAFHPSCLPLIHRENVEDIYEIVGERKVLSGELEEDSRVGSSRPITLTRDDDDDDDSEDTSDEDDDSDDEDTSDDQESVRSTAICTSDLIQKTLVHMQNRVSKRQVERELPARVKRMKAKCSGRS